MSHSTTNFDTRVLARVIVEYRWQGIYPNVVVNDAARLDFGDYDPHRLTSTRRCSIRLLTYLQGDIAEQRATGYYGQHTSYISTKQTWSMERETDGT